MLQVTVYPRYLLSLSSSVHALPAVALVQETEGFSELLIHLSQTFPQLAGKDLNTILSEECVILDVLGREILTDLHWQDSCHDCCYRDGQKQISITILFSQSLSLDNVISAFLSVKDLVRGEKRERKKANQFPIVTCTRLFFPETPLLQPAYCFVDTDLQSLPICVSCQEMFDASLVSVVGTEREREGHSSAFICQSEVLAEMGFAIPEMKDALTRDQERVVSFNQAELVDCPPISLYLQRRLFEEMLSLSLSVSHSDSISTKLSHFSRRLEAGLQTRLAWEDPDQQRMAREEIQYAKILHYFEEELENRNNTQDAWLLGQQEGQADSGGGREWKCEEELLLIAIMKWFKRDFFAWCNKPHCANDLSCDGRPGDMENIGLSPSVTEEERNQGRASRVELYRCRKCKQVTRFPRHNNAGYMMKKTDARKGRCGEFANVFGLILRSLGMDVCYVLDFTDHVWVEVYLPNNSSHQGRNLNRYIHADPCERAYDSPLMYEKGWQKTLSHIFSFSPLLGIQDVSPRYSRQWREIVNQREREKEFGISEKCVREIVEVKSREFANRLMRERENMGERVRERDWDWRDMVSRLRRGREGFEDLWTSGSRLLGEREMMERKEKAWREIEGLRFLSPSFSLPRQQKKKKTVGEDAETRGRTSGDIEWRRQRGEVRETEAVAERGREREGENNEVVCDARTMTCQTNVDEGPGEKERERERETEKDREREKEERERQRLERVFQCLQTSSKWQHLKPFLSLSPSLSPSHRVFSLSLARSGYCDIRFSFDSLSPSLSPSSLSLFPRCGNKRLFPHNESLSLAPFSLQSRLSIDHCPIALCKNALTVITLTREGEMQWTATSSLSLPLSLSPSSLSPSLCLFYLHHEEREGLEKMILSLSLSQSLSLSVEDSEALRSSLSPMTRDLFLFCSLSPSLSPPQLRLLSWREREGEGQREREKAIFTAVSCPSLSLSSLGGERLTPCSIRLRVSLSPSLSTTASLRETERERESERQYECLSDCAIVSATLHNLHSLPSPPEERERERDWLESKAREILSQYTRVTQDSMSVSVSGVTVFPRHADRPASLAIYALPPSIGDGVRERESYAIQVISRPGCFSLLPLSLTASLSPAHQSSESNKKERKRERVSESQPDWSISDSRLYFYCGGGEHGDTLYFDSSESVPCGHALSSITLYAGDNLVNGVSSTIFPSLSSTVSSSSASSISSNDDIDCAKFSSSDGQNITRTIRLDHDRERVSKVIVHAGALIDRIELHTASGSYVTVGGRGGERRELTVPSSLSLLGMFGGTGGHLHNVGFVFSLSNPGPVSQPATDPSIQLRHRLWQQMKTMGLWTHSPIGLFNATERESLQVERFAREDSWRHADYQGFVDRASAIIHHARQSGNRETIEKVKVAMNSIIKYFQNIHKNPADENFQRIKLANNFLQNKILQAVSTCTTEHSSVMQLLCFGPAGFYIDLDSVQLVSRFASQVWKQGVLPSQQFVRRDGLLWIERYCQLLQFVVSLL